MQSCDILKLYTQDIEAVNRWGIMKRYILFLTGLCISSTISLITVITQTDYLKAYIQFLTGLENRHLDMLVLPVSILIVFSVVQLLVNRRYEIIEAEKAKIYKAMIHSTHHVLNNLLNNMMLFKLTAEETPEFPRDILNLFDQVIRDASAQIRSLSTIERINARSIEESVAPKAKG